MPRPTRWISKPITNSPREYATIVLIGLAVIVIFVGVGFIAPRLLMADSDETPPISDRSIIVLPRANSDSNTEVEPQPTVSQEGEQPAENVAAATPGPDLSARGGRGPIETIDLSASLTNEAISEMVLWTDQPVEEDRVTRDWVWGPNAITEPIDEAFEHDRGDTRIVQYFQKGRVELPVDDSGQWAVTSGLLVNELMSGSVQVGVDGYQKQEPASMPIFDLEAPGPTYPDLVKMLDQEPFEDGTPISQRLSVDGELEDVPALGRRGIVAVRPDSSGDHSIAEPFWEFMTSKGEIYDGDEYRVDDLFVDPYFVTGLPITEPFWVNVEGDVLGQCFERRCLLYAPDDGAAWRVRSNDVGVHYFTWRYGLEVS